MKLPITAAVVLLLVTPSAVEAAQRLTYDQAAFAAAQARNERILIDISATWCPTCKAQKPIISALATDPVNRDLVIFDVDFDTQKQVVRSFRAQMQSTLIAFRGSVETARSVGDTEPASITALVDTTRAK